MSALPLIGLAGRARSGKDSAAHVLREFGYQSASFADPLREMAYDINPVLIGTGDRPLYYRDAMDRYGYERAKDLFPEVRRFLQRLGTQGIRDHLGADTWVHLAERRMFNGAGPFVFTDVRFANEADMIRRNGGVVMEVKREGHMTHLTAHASELIDFPVDLTIHNDSTLPVFQQRVRDAIGIATLMTS